ncbi:hypothetical protein IW261DRAFT_1564400 [Armillaria novae-zelandiae]|uniref:Uncharacterized protein n=1 Tax=Armillaria novae-zelandiae TaxID=153914 RepID=A0AA39UEZ8_9AGAR|nr:hypothetical protein IW261DRAFT_1564400 [Armillaria novae-zelandiae]
MLSVPLQLFPAVRIMENGLFVRSGKIYNKVKWLNLMILPLISQLRIGKDLSRVTFSTFFLEPCSMLESITDSMSHPDLILGSEDTEYLEECFSPHAATIIFSENPFDVGTITPMAPTGTISQSKCHITTTMEDENRVLLLGKPEDGDKDIEAVMTAKSAGIDAQRETRKNVAYHGQNLGGGVWGLRFFVHKNGRWEPKVEIPVDPIEAERVVNTSLKLTPPIEKT